MQVMPVRWKVKQYLEAHNLTPYRLMKESGLAQGTVYRLVNGDTHNLNASTLDATIKALSSLTGEHVDISDVLEYQRES
jgi:DNA-binding Xre family transcriptional regulator